MINIFTESILTLDDRNSVKNYVKVQDYMTCGVVVIQNLFFNRKYPMQGTLAFGGRCYSVTLMPKSWRRYKHCKVLIVLTEIISLNVHVSLTANVLSLKDTQ